MYVTRPLSMYKRNPGALSDPPPSGPYSGYLVILDEEAQAYTCFGSCKDNRIRHLPFPQNKNLTIHYSTGENSRTEKAMFVPVLNQPLSSNRYYVIRRKGKHQGFVQDVKPSPLEPFNDYQQVEIIKKGYGFNAKSVAQDGIPPDLLRKKRWTVYASTPHDYHLGEALGLNVSLRAQLPYFNFPLSSYSSESVVVGKWYCPFMFVMEGMKLKDQMKMSVFYELTLQQRWEKIFSKENENSGEVAVFVDVVIQTEVTKVAGREAIWDNNGGVLWFRSFDDVGVETSVGLSLELVEGMKWVQERGGWIAVKDK